MPLVERIQTLAKEKGTNIKQIEIKCGIGNGTIRRWNDQAPRLDKIKVVADYLQVSLDFLVYGSKELAFTYSDLSLSADEANLLVMYRLIDKRDQKTIFDLIKLKYEQFIEESPKTPEETPNEEPRRIPFAASGWADITPEADAMIQEKLREFEKRAEELKRNRGK